MDSFDDDMFALSDEELPIPTTKWNAVEEHLAKQLGAVQTRIVETISDINEIQDTKRRILKSLQYQARYGENATSDSDSNVSHPITMEIVEHENIMPDSNSFSTRSECNCMRSKYECVRCVKIYSHSVDVQHRRATSGEEGEAQSS